MCPCIIWCALVVYLLYHPLIQCVCVCVWYLSIGETCMSARFCWLVRFILGMGTLYVSLYNLVCFCCIPVVSPLNSMCVCVCVYIYIYISIYLYIYMFYIYIYIYIFLMHIQNKKKKILTWLMSWYNKMVYSDCNIAMWFASWSMFNGESTLPCFLTIYSSYFILVNGIAEEFCKFFEIIQIVNWDIFFFGSEIQ